MGLLDILNGMQNGPRGTRQPAPPGQGSGHMSPLMLALLGLLAYKAVKHLGGSGSAPSAGTPPQSLPPGTADNGRGGASSGTLSDILTGMLNGPRGGTTSASVPSSGTPGTGGLGDILGGILGGAGPGGKTASGGAGVPGGLGGILGGLLGGAAAGSVLNGGLGQVLQDLERNGQGGAVKSWVGSGDNEQIAPGDLANALGADTVDAVAQQTGMSRDELLTGLSQHLPELVNQLTPHGRLPTAEEASRW